jgi:hypothetical protein
MKPLFVLTFIGLFFNFHAQAATCDRALFDQFTTALGNQKAPHVLAKILGEMDTPNCELDGESPLTYLYTSHMPSNELIEALVEVGVDFNYKLKDGSAVLPDFMAQIILNLHDLPAVVKAVELGADLNLRGRFGLTLLHRLMSLKEVRRFPGTQIGLQGEDFLPLFDRLIELGADPKLEDLNGQNAFEIYFVSYLNKYPFLDSKMALELLKRAAALNLLHHEFKSEPRVDDLYRHKTEPMNLLSVILLTGADDVVDAMLKSGWSQTLKQPGGYSPISAAVLRALQGFEFGYRFYPRDIPFHYLKQFFKNGYSLNEVDAEGMTSLWHAVLPTGEMKEYIGNREYLIFAYNGIIGGLAEFLVKNGADLNRTYEGDSFVTYASTCQRGNSGFGNWLATPRESKDANLTLLKLVLAKGADANSKNSKGESALQLALSTDCSPAVVQTLKSYGAH